MAEFGANFGKNLLIYWANTPSGKRSNPMAKRNVSFAQGAMNSRAVAEAKA